ncbi:hypothetical protein [Salipiger sp. PrR003]|uniref:hypothetical protein n=1 Tax=Salipiger sp. PrR003 TaxID=2706776 RepID=UPI0013DBA589|nr:hypothetical protein [Salipiger sp. PrR003]NDV53017.1 hypothetical protein [Salipiger sp. PrR003]
MAAAIRQAVAIRGLALLVCDPNRVGCGSLPEVIFKWNLAVPDVSQTQPAAPADGRSDTSDERVRKQLYKMVASRALSCSPNRLRLFEYIVEETLAGRPDRLRGDVIAFEVFERGDDFDPQADPVVRIESRRLRKEIESYYSGAGHQDSVVISVPKGAYLAEFSFKERRQSEPSAGTDAAVSPREARPKVGLLWIAVIAALVLGAAAIPTIMGLRLSDLSWNGAERQAVGPPGLAIAPFQVRGSSREDLYFAQGISDQLLNDLQPFETVRVFALPADRGSPTESDLATLRAGHQIDYVLTGSYRSAEDGGPGRLIAQLIHTDGRVVWSRSDNVARTAADFFAVQDHIASGIASELAQTYGVLWGQLRRVILDRPLPNEGTFACLLLSHAYRRSLSVDLRNEALDCLRTAVQREPDNAEGWAMLALVTRDQAVMQTDTAVRRPDLLEEALQAAQRAVHLDPQSILALQAQSSLLHTMGEFDAAEATMRSALALNPNDPESLHQLGWRLAVRGALKEGTEYIRQAILRSIDPPGRYHNLLAVEALMDHRYDDMLGPATISANAHSVVGLALLAIANNRAADGSPVIVSEAIEALKQTGTPMAKTPLTYLQSHGVNQKIAGTIVSEMIEAGWSPDESASAP